MTRVPTATVAVAILFAACSGDSTPTPAPSGPNGGGAKSIAADAGNNQTVTAGELVPVPPRVIVRDEEGKGVAGVTVTFKIMSGAGTITDSVVTTGTSGTAALGSWRLGQGNNVVQASALTLSPVQFVAVGTAPSTVVSSGTIPGGGGSFTVNKPGHPLHGMTITAPASAFQGTVALTVRANDVAAPTLPTGASIASPVITIESDRPLNSSASLTLHIPVATNANELPIVITFDPATGEKLALPTVREGATGVRTVTRVLDGSLLAASSGHAGTAAASQSSTQTEFAVRAVVGTVPLAQLSGDLDSGYRPALDDWELNHTVKLFFEETHYRYNNGLAIAAAWYYDKFRMQGPLNKRFQEAEGIELSNPRGFKLGVELTSPFKENFSGIVGFNASVAGLLELDGGTITMDSLLLLGVKAGIYLTGRPQPFLAGNLDDGNTSPVLTMLAYRTHGSTMDVTLGTSVSGLNEPRSLTLNNGSFGTISWGHKDPFTNQFKSYTMNEYFFFGQTATLAAADLNAQWQRVFNGTIGDGSPWFPSWRLVSTDERPITDTVFISDDSLRIWFECPNCEFGLTPSEGISPQGKVGAAALAELTEGGWIRLSMTDGEVFENGKLLTADDHDGKHYGAIVLEAADAAGETVGYLDWTEFVVKARKLTITPDNDTVKPDEEFTLTATFDRSLPPNPSYEWDMGDGRKIVTQTNEITTSYPMPGNGMTTVYNVSVRLLSGDKKHAHGKTKITLDVAVAPYWILSTFNDINGLFSDEDIEGGGELYDGLKRASEVPGSAAITIDTLEGGAVQLRLRVLKTGAWDPAVCCPLPPHNPSTEYLITLGVRPTVSHPVGPFFAGWGTSHFTETPQAFPPDMRYEGQFVPATVTYNVKDGGVQTGPAGGVRTNLLTNANLMSGQIDLYIWFFDEEVEDPPDVFTFLLTGVRMQ